MITRFEYAEVDGWFFRVQQSCFSGQSPPIWALNFTYFLDKIQFLRVPHIVEYQEPRLQFGVLLKFNFFRKLNKIPIYNT